eukprot:m.186905 g.186905  ORF g.186905 m.186905 type:complete len:315 (-) comp14766_c0_seq1:650-1594(-)
MDVRGDPTDNGVDGVFLLAEAAALSSPIQCASCTKWQHDQELFVSGGGTDALTAGQGLDTSSTVSLSDVIEKLPLSTVYKLVEECECGQARWPNWIKQVSLKKLEEVLTKEEELNDAALEAIFQWRHGQGWAADDQDGGSEALERLRGAARERRMSIRPDSPEELLSVNTQLTPTNHGLDAGTALSPSVLISPMNKLLESPGAGVLPRYTVHPSREEQGISVEELIPDAAASCNIPFLVQVKSQGGSSRWMYIQKLDQHSPSPSATAHVHLHLRPQPQLSDSTKQIDSAAPTSGIYSTSSASPPSTQRKIQGST